jgi:hypothetical protein
VSKWLTLLLLLPTNLFSQINVHKAGDGWDDQVKTAILLIQKTSSKYYCTLEDVVQTVEFWNESYSSNNIIEGKGVIVIAANDVKLNSINNLAAVLVHESFHLYCLKNKLVFSANQEECLSYSYELEFLKLLQNVEPDLINYTKQQIENYK